MDFKRLAKAIGILAAVVVAIVLINAFFLMLLHTGLLPYFLIAMFAVMVITFIYKEFT